MHRRTRVRAAGAPLALVFLAALACAGQERADRRPNLLVILADDLGYADLGVHGCKDIPTPHIDALAREGVRCLSGYVTGPRCAPTRAGLMAGRYEQRYGCELGADLPTTETTIAERLRAAGYATGLVGKWHLGIDAEHDPNARGFDEFFGFVGGVNEYLPGADGIVPGILRDRAPAAERAYLTDAFGREACAFVERHAREPFFLLLAFSAPHRPLEAAPEDLARFAGIADPQRRSYAAMVASMDDAVGSVMAKLHALDLDEETLVLFLNDNGGLLGKRQRTACSNAPLRDEKGSTFEGGVHVPFFVRWKGVLPAGGTYERPVSSLDIHPTALALAHVAVQPEWKLDGVDLLPFLTGKDERAPHDVLYWRFTFPPARPQLHRWAIRKGDLKLVHGPPRDPVTGEKSPSVTALFDLARDPGETTDLGGQRPKERQELLELWQRWSATLPPPPAYAEPEDDEER